MTPYFSNVSDFIHMQGHGTFVWICYGISFLVIAFLIGHAMSERKAVIAKLHRQQQSKQKSERLTNKQRKELGAQNTSQ